MVGGHRARGPRHRAPLPAITIGDYLAAVAARGPRCRSSVGDDARRLTYAELALDVERVACGLLALGIEKGDRIAIWAPETTEWTLVQLAAARAGALLMILDADWNAEQVDAALRETNVRLLVTAGSERVAGLGDVRREPPALERLVTLDGLSGWADDLTWGELLVAGSAIDPAQLTEREATLHPDDAVSIEYARLASGELEATTLTHRDYLAVTGE